MSGSKPRRARVRRARGSPGIGSSPRASPACLLSASIRSAPDLPTRPECRTSKAETAERRRASRRRRPPPPRHRSTRRRRRPTNRSRGNARSYLPCRCTGTCCAPRTGARPTARRRATRKTCARWKTNPSAKARRARRRTRRPPTPPRSDPRGFGNTAVANLARVRSGTACGPASFVEISTNPNRPGKQSPRARRPRRRPTRTRRSPSPRVRRNRSPLC